MPSGTETDAVRDAMQRVNFGPGCDARHAVYLILNQTNGKGYIGKTCRGVRFRVREHIRTALNGGSFPIGRAMIAHGFDKFEVTTLAECDDEDLLSLMECEWIAKCGTNSRTGYNLTDGATALPATRTLRKAGTDVARRQKSWSAGLPRCVAVRGLTVPVSIALTTARR